MMSGYEDDNDNNNFYYYYNTRSAHFSQKICKIFTL